MKILTFWYVACIIFAIYNLNILIQESQDIVYQDKNRSETDPITILVCKEFKIFNLRKTWYKMSEVKVYLRRHFRNPRYDILKEESPKRFKNLILNPIENGTYRIFNGQLCFVAKSYKDLLDIVPFLSKVSGSKPAMLFAFKESTADFVKLTKFNDRFDQLVMLKKGLYSNCSESNSRFACLNDCCKRRFRLARYFYGGNETEFIYLSTSMNRSVEESEKSCLVECQRENCKIVQLILIPSFEDRALKITTLEAQPKLGKFDFCIQFIGLVCSFANISLNKFASLLIRFASSKVRKRKVKIALVYLRWTIFFLSLAYCGYLYTTWIIDYKKEERDPPKSEIKRNHIKQKDVRLVICLNVAEYLPNNSHSSRTMLEIERATDRALDDYLKGIYLKYRETMFRINYTPELKVLFSYRFGALFRCFSLSVRPDYQLMTSNLKLSIIFGKHVSTLFLLTENENLNEETFQYAGRFAFRKSIVKRLKSSGRCVDYQEKYANCTSRLHCVTSCINRKAFGEFKKIIVNERIVDRDQFRLAEWNRAYPMEISSDLLGNSAYKNLSEACSEEIPDEKPCIEIKFEKTVRFAIEPKAFSIEIDLFLDVVLSIENLSWFNLLLNIMSTHSIFFSVTVLSLLRMLYNFIKTKVRIRNDKIALFLIYLLCSIGFTWHTFRILDQSFNGDLTYNIYYEIANQIQMPEMVFCDPINSSLIDKNHKLTGNYLEEITSHVTIKSLFKRIDYLNGLNEWRTLDLSLVEHIFFIHLKCFRIRLDQEYDRNQLLFSTSSQALEVLKVNFEKNFEVDKQIWLKTVYFMTKTNETSEFSNTVSLKYVLDFSVGRYSAEQIALTVSYDDHLGFIKRHFWADQKDDFHEGRLPELEKDLYNFETLNTPLEKDDFHRELEDDLYEQFVFSQTQDVTNHNLLDSLNFQQTSVFNHLKKEEIGHPGPDFTFSLASIKKNLLVNNEAKLILGLLNVLFWFNLGILDVYPIIPFLRDYLLVRPPLYLLAKFTQALLFCSKWLKKLKPPLGELLKSHKQNSPESN